MITIRRRIGAGGCPHGPYPYGKGKACEGYLFAPFTQGGGEGRSTQPGLRPQAKRHARRDAETQRSNIRPRRNTKTATPFQTRRLSGSARAPVLSCSGSLYRRFVSTSFSWRSWRSWREKSRFRASEAAQLQSTASCCLAQSPSLEPRELSVILHAETLRRREHQDCDTFSNPAPLRLRARYDLFGYRNLHRRAERISGGSESSTALQFFVASWLCVSSLSFRPQAGSR